MSSIPLLYFSPNAATGSDAFLKAVAAASSSVSEKAARVARTVSPKPFPPSAAARRAGVSSWESAWRGFSGSLEPGPAMSSSYSDHMTRWSRSSSESLLSTSSSLSTKPPSMWCARAIRYATCWCTAMLSSRISGGGSRSPSGSLKGTARATSDGSSSSSLAICSPASTKTFAGLSRVMVPASAAGSAKSIFMTSISAKAPPLVRCDPSSANQRVSLPPYGATRTEGSFSFSSIATTPLSTIRILSPGSSMKWKVSVRLP
mmetsp:Transcript_15895/g.47252  ORF Transcript_15895/g.47252 Transcript_15895/m.47252 type:complete len:260 (-) Transcript_15895:1906-2685(-)